MADTKPAWGREDAVGGSIDIKNEMDVDEDEADAPPLVAGSGSDSSDDDDSDDEMPVTERLARGESLKDAGNEKFRAKEWARALDQYDAAWKMVKELDGKEPPEVFEDVQTLMNKLALSLDLNRAAACNKLEKWTEAIKYATNALKRDSSNTKAYFRRGFARVRRGLLEKAKADFLAAIKLDPKNKQALKELQRVKVRLSQHKKAERKTFARAFQRATIDGGMYSDKEEERKKREEKKKKQLEERKARWRRDNEKREQAAEPAISYEDWDKEEKKKEKERAEKVKKEKEKRSREKAERERKARALAKASNAASDEVELDEADLKAIEETKKMGYCYHKRELATEETELIGSIAPTRIIDTSVGSVGRKTSASAWNQAGTWEEKDITEWAKGKLKMVLKDLIHEHEYCPIDEEDTADAMATVHVLLTSVSEVGGVAQIVNVNKKVRRIYDMNVKLKWTVELPSNGEKAKRVLSRGELSFPDLSPSGKEDNGRYEHQVKYTKDPKSSDRGLVRAALAGFVTRVCSKFGLFVEMLQAA